MLPFTPHLQKSRGEKKITSGQKAEGQTQDIKSPSSFWSVSLSFVKQLKPRNKNSQLIEPRASLIVPENASFADCLIFCYPSEKPSILVKIPHFQDSATTTHSINLSPRLQIFLSRKATLCSFVHAGCSPIWHFLVTDSHTFAKSRNNAPFHPSPSEIEGREKNHEWPKSWRTDSGYQKSQFFLVCFAFFCQAIEAQKQKFTIDWAEGISLRSRKCLTRWLPRVLLPFWKAFYFGKKYTFSRFSDNYS